MHIVYVHQYFKTPEEGGALRSYYLAKGLVEAGHTVSMVTTHNRPYYLYNEIKGIAVHYLPVYYHQNLNFRARVLAFLKFVWKTIRLSSSINAVDLCYVTSTPLSVGLIGLYLNWRRGIPFYFEVRDLWPEAPVQMGILKGRLIKKALYKFERTVYNRAEKLIALSPPVRDYMLQIKNPEKVFYIPNMADCGYFKPEKKYQSPLFGSFGANKFVVSYIGALGKANQLERLLLIAEVCQEKAPSICFLIAGDGSEKIRLKKVAASKNLVNLQFLPFQNKEGVREILGLTDAVFIGYAAYPILSASSPNKMFDALAAGKLCITNTGGWIRVLLENNEAGFYAEEPEDFLQKITPFLNKRERLTAYQRNARKLAENQFSREKVVNQWVNLITGVV